MIYLVNKLKNNPGFNDIDESIYDFYEGVFHGETYGYLAISNLPDPEAVVHFVFNRFKPGSFKQSVIDWFELLKIIKKRGIKRVHAINHNINDAGKWAKFIQLYGFNEPQVLMMSTMEV